MKKNVILLWAMLLFVSLAFADQEDAAPAAPEIRIGGYIQGNYTAVQNDVQVSTDSFSLKRVRVSILIDMQYNISGYIEADAKNGIIKDAYVSYAPLPGLSVHFGQQKIPVSVESLTSGSKLDFIEYSRVVDELVRQSPGARDIGVKIVYKRAWWECAGMVSNGSGENQEDENENKAYSGRMAVSFDSISFGGSGYRSVEEAILTRQDEKITRMSGDVHLGNEAGFLKAEYIYGKDGTIKKSGWTITGDSGIPFVSPLAYHKIPLRMLVRFEQWDPNRSVDKDEESRIVFGLLYPVTAYLKIDLNYTLVQEEADPQIDNNRFNAQVQLAF